MKPLVVIPARFASTRYPGKPLVGLTGATGEVKSLIERSWDAAKSVAGIDACVVATDDDRIRDHVLEFGGDVAMTSTSCRNGTERCAEVAAQRPEFDLIVNFQGDAPLTPPWFVTEILKDLEAHQNAAMATPVLRLDPEHLASFREDRRHDRVGGTTAIFAPDGRAIYFSKEVLPFTPTESDAPFYHHVGVYAYRRASLLAYADTPETELEKREGLEQLRFIVNGEEVRCSLVEAQGRSFWELNNPEDVPRIERILKDDNIS